MVVTEQRHLLLTLSRAHAPGRGVVQCACERITRRELTDLQRNSQPPVPSVSKCAHFQLASLLLICTKSNLAESARCAPVAVSCSGGACRIYPSSCCDACMMNSSYSAAVSKLGANGPSPFPSLNSGGQSQLSSTLLKRLSETALSVPRF